MKFLYASTRLPPVPLTITTLYDTYITAVSTIFLLGYKDYKKKEGRHLDSELIHAHLFPKAKAENDCTTCTPRAFAISFSPF